VFTWPDGKKYEGEWKGGKQDGVGQYDDGQGNVMYGKWESGKRTAWITED